MQPFADCLSTHSKVAGRLGLAQAPYLERPCRGLARAAAVNAFGKFIESFGIVLARSINLFNCFVRSEFPYGRDTVHESVPDLALPYVNRTRMSVCRRLQAARGIRQATVSSPAAFFLKAPVDRRDGQAFPLTATSRLGRPLGIGSARGKEIPGRLPARQPWIERSVNGGERASNAGTCPPGQRMPRLTC